MQKTQDTDKIVQTQGARDWMVGTRAKILPLLGNQFQPQVSGHCQLAGAL